MTPTEWNICGNCGKTGFLHAITGLLAYCGSERSGRRSGLTKKEILSVRRTAGMPVTMAMREAVLREATQLDLRGA